VRGFPTVLMMPCDQKPPPEPPRPTMVAGCSVPQENAPGRVIGFIDAREMLERLRKVQ